MDNFTSRKGFSHMGSVITGTVNNHGLHMSGNHFSGPVNILGGKGGSDESREDLCKKALFLTNPIDDKSQIEDNNDILIPGICQWIHNHPSFKSWHENTSNSDLLWVSGAYGMGKTMMSLFLIEEIKRTQMQARGGIVLYYFLDSCNDKRNSAVAILRGLIYMMVRQYSEMIHYLMEDFEFQREGMFSSNSLDALWRIFETMLSDPRAARAICVIDGLDECQHDSLKPFLKKLCKFYENQRHIQEQIQNINPAFLSPIASMKMVLLSQEEPECIRETLSHFPRVRIEDAAVYTSGTKTQKPKSSAAGSAKKAGSTAPKLSSAVQLALKKKRVEDAKAAIAKAEANTATGMQSQTVVTLENAVAALSVDEQQSQQSATAEVPVDASGGHASVIATGTEEYVFDEEVAEGDGAVEEVEEEEEEEDVAEPVLPLALYIGAKITEMAQELGPNPAEASIIDRLHTRGDGTFLWVDLAIGELKRYAPEHALQVVEQLPPDVNDMYCRFIRQIQPNMVQLVVAVLRWVIAARRPLTINELSAALTNMGFSTHDPLGMTKQGITACTPLLKLNKDGVINITHTSFKNLLTSQSGPLWSDPSLSQFYINVADADGEIASLLLSYLERGCLNDGSSSVVEEASKYNQRCVQYPLFSYATIFWPDHLRSASRPNLNLAAPFFAKKSNVRKNWWLSYYPEKTKKGPMLAPRDFSLLHLAAYLNLPTLAHQLEQRGEVKPRIDSRDTHGNTPLALAAMMGSMDMLLFLMQRGASHECLGENVFELACRRGQTSIVEYLLNMGYNPNVPARDIGALESLGKSTRWIHGIISEGVELDIDLWRLMARDTGTGGTPVYNASLGGHTDVVKLLLERGANVHAATTKRWTALHGASWTGQTECVKLLLEHGAKALDVTDSGWNPMHCAAARGKASLVQFYIGLEMPVDALTVKRKSALHLAAYNGSASTLRVLMAAGAAVDLQSHKGETALHLATRRVKPEAVEALLAGGAERMVQNNAGATALDTIKMIKGTLSEDNAEIQRILETFGTPGYVPWTPKADPKAAVTAAAAAATGPQGSSQFMGMQPMYPQNGMIQTMNGQPTPVTPMSNPYAASQPYGTPPPPYTQTPAFQPTPQTQVGYFPEKTSHGSPSQAVGQSNLPSMYQSPTMSGAGFNGVHVPGTYGSNAAPPMAVPATPGMTAPAYQNGPVAGPASACPQAQSVSSPVYQSPTAPMSMSGAQLMNAPAVISPYLQSGVPSVASPAYSNPASGSAAFTPVSGYPATSIEVTSPVNTAPAVPNPYAHATSTVASNGVSVPAISPPVAIGQSAAPATQHPPVMATPPTTQPVTAEQPTNMMDANSWAVPVNHQPEQPAVELHANVPLQPDPSLESNEQPTVQVQEPGTYQELPANTMGQPQGSIPAASPSPPQQEVAHNSIPSENVIPVVAQQESPRQAPTTTPVAPIQQQTYQHTMASPTPYPIAPQQGFPPPAQGTVPGPLAHQPSFSTPQPQQAFPSNLAIHTPSAPVSQPSFQSSTQITTPGLSTMANAAPGAPFQQQPQWSAPTPMAMGAPAAIQSPYQSQYQAQTHTPQQSWMAPPTPQVTPQAQVPQIHVANPLPAMTHQTWTQPAIQTPSVIPQTTGAGYPSQTTFTAPAATPSYDAGGFPTNPTAQAAGQVAFNPPGVQQQQQQQQPWQNPQFVAQPGYTQQQYGPQGNLSVGYMPGQYGAGGQMQFAPPPMGHPGMQKKRSIMNLGGLLK
ncbi:hypothetical protein jhhlp_007836 [Lomentospora prolificans]|uniref:NACHT domain-containing protein n=1 Tax=Lomentospora prolificans TaxID=41688 RepID=A0A2N3N0Q0_9PEZI|nr:hypothetical protein jhhlp_007836 [Lomentospora prolificans]